MFYLTQDQDCVDQEVYDILIRTLDPSLSGPDTDDNTAPVPPGAVTLMTPPNGPPSPCAWGISINFTSPIEIPCARSTFVGMSLANNTAWVTNGQSLQGSWLQGGGPNGDPGAVDSAQISWQIDSAGAVGQCGAARVWDYGVMVSGAVLNMGNIHPDVICTVNPACGIGGLYPSNTARGDGLALCVRSASTPAGPMFSFVGFSPSPAPLALPSILQKPILIGPAPFVQISFGGNSLVAGEGRDTAPFLAPGTCTG